MTALRVYDELLQGDEKVDFNIPGSGFPGIQRPIRDIGCAH